MWHIKSGNLIDHMQKKSLCILYTLGIRRSNDQFDKVWCTVLSWAQYVNARRVSRIQQEILVSKMRPLFLTLYSLRLCKKSQLLAPSGTKALFGLHILSFRACGIPDDHVNSLEIIAFCHSNIQEYTRTKLIWSVQPPDAPGREKSCL
jgi:hypothetical protein